MSQDPSKTARRPRGRRAAVAVGIHAVAARAGVSISTVSRCLTGKRVLAPEVERRILEAVRVLRYSPNRMASSLRTQRTLALGMIIPDNSNPYFSDVVKGAEDVARAAGFLVLLFNSGESHERERQYLATLQSFRCEGALMICAPRARGDEPPAAVDWGYPVVHLGRDPGFETDLVVVDGKGAGRQAVQHLVALGHRRVAVLAGGDDNASFRERVEGYRAGLAQAGLAPRPEYEVRVPVTPGDGHAATLRLLALARPPTAIFAASNTLGIAAVGAIEAARLRCPRDVSVVSYDSYGWQEVFHPRLTTVRQPAYRLGARAAEALLARIEGRGGGVAERVVLDADLVIRESTAPPVAARR